jgi:FKBP-type peptidyl-prolyl cis-trans isomerase 2
MKKPGNTKSKDKNKGASDRLLKAGTVVVLLICVVGFTLTMGFFSFFKTAQPGSICQVDYTLYDASGVPIVTSNERVAQAEYEKGNLALLSEPLVLTVGEEYPATFIPVALRYPEGSSNTMLAGELSQINFALQGMRQNEQKTVEINGAETMVTTMTAEEFDGIVQGYGTDFNFNVAEAGDWVPLGLSSTPIIALENSTPEIYIRYGKVAQKTTDEITVAYGYPTASITLEYIGN